MANVLKYSTGGNAGFIEVGSNLAPAGVGMMTPDSKAPVLVRVMVAMITVPFVFMALRFYCKLGTTRRFGWDDAVLLLSWVCEKSSPGTCW